MTRGELFGGGKVREVWVDGNRYEAAKDETSPAGKWSLDWGHGAHAFEIATGTDTTVTLVVGADTLKARDVRLDDKRVRFTFQQGGRCARGLRPARGERRAHRHR